MKTWRRYFIVFVLASMFAVQPAVYAQTNASPSSRSVQKEGTDAGTLIGTPTPEVGREVEYTLPYPGILPDHPLYFLKSLRDSIINLLITDPLKKAEFAKLRSDKFIGMGSMLVKKGNWDLAVKTFMDSNAEMRKAVTGLATLQKNSVTVPSHLVNNINLAVAKHLEVLQGIDGNSAVAGRMKEIKEELGKLQAEADKLR